MKTTNLECQSSVSTGWASRCLYPCFLRPWTRSKIMRGWAWLKGSVSLLALSMGLGMGMAQAQNSAEGFDLRLSTLGQGKMDLTHATMSLGFVLVVIAIYAAVISIFHVRARRLWNEHDEEQGRTIRDSQARLERSSLFLAADRRLIIAWGGPDGAPEFEGDPGLLLETATPSRILSFNEWLPEEAARRLDRAVLQLRSEGTAFVENLRSLRHDFVEIEGRPMAGRAVMSIRLATGERLALARAQDEKIALESAQAQLQSVLNAIPQPVWLRDRAGKLGWVNAAYAQAVEAPDSAMALSRQAEFLDSNHRALIKQEQAKAGRYQGALTAIVAGQRRTVDVVEVTGPQGGGGFALDVSELEATRLALERQMDAHVRTLDELPTAVAIFDQHQQLVYINKAFRDLFQLDAAFLASAPTNAALLDRLRVEGRLPEQSDYKAWKTDLLAQYHATDTFEQGWSLPNGRALRVVLSPNPQGGITYLFEDETERFTLATSYDRLKNTQGETLTALSEGVAVFGSDGKLQLTNPAFARLWGFEETVLERQPHIEMLAQLVPSGADIWQSISALVCGLSDQRFDQSFETITVDGRVLSVATTPLPDGATLITTSDVTDTVEAERRLLDHNEALRRAERLRTDFIKSVSFELRSPLTSVVGLAQALAGGVAGSLSEKQQAYAEDLVRSSDAVLALIDDILDLGSIESGDLELEYKDVDVARAIQEATEGLKDRLGDAKKVRLALNVSTEIGALKADPTRLRHIVFNLLANAVSFSEHGDVVRLSVRRAGPDVLFEVQDPGRGPGVGLAGLPDQGVPEVERENGLRFSLAKALVQLHHGRIAVTEGEGGSHVVQVWLPQVWPEITPSA